VTEKNLHDRGIRKVADLADSGDGFLETEFGAWGEALAGKAQGEDAGAWFSRGVGEDDDAKSISHETTFNEDTDHSEILEATLMRLSQMVARRLREAGLYGRTIGLKLRYTDFSTITRACTLDESTQLDNIIFETVRRLFRENWHTGWKPTVSNTGDSVKTRKRSQTPYAVRLLGVQASGLTRQAGQISLLDQDRAEKWRKALKAADGLRDRYGERSIELASGLRQGWRERTHENPAGLPGKRKRD
jgi:DNA polymerase-4